MTITKIDRSTCRAIRLAIDENLAEIGAELGIKFTAGHGSYDDTSVTIKVQCVLAGVDKDKENFERSAFLFGLPKEAYGEQFSHRNVGYRLVGLKPNSPKYPILGRRGDGKQFKFQESAVKHLKTVKRELNVTVVDFDPDTTENLRGNGEVGR